MRKLTKSLVLIVWNELAGCQVDVPVLPTEEFDETYVIDGGSTDGTVEFLQENGLTVFKQRKKSLNAAYMDAVAHSNCEAVIVFFPKGTINPSIIGEMSKHLDAGYDLVVASRNLPGAHNEEDDHFLKPRKWGVSALSNIASILWRTEGWRIRDVLHGVKAFTKSANTRMQISDSGVTVDLEMTVRAYRLKIPRMEFPVTERVRTYGETKFKIWPTGKRLAYFILRECFRRI